eukprot:gene15759-24069_t
MDAATMSTKELKDVVKRAGLEAKLVGISEKSDLVALAKEAVALVESGQRAPPEPAHEHAPRVRKIAPGASEVRLGDWDCRVVAPAAGEPKRAVVILHGFGATSGDFAPLARSLHDPLPKDILWVFPQAAEDPTLGASAWWKISVPEWISAQGNESRVAKLIRKRHDGLDACREQGKKLLRDIEEHTGIAAGDVHLAGFSQGAMTAMDLALHIPDAPGSVAMFSGSPIVVDEWAECLKKKQNLKIFVSHGKNDPV